MQTPPAAEQMSRARRLFVLAICCLSLLLVVMDGTIVNIALPAIHRSLHAKLDGLQWTIDAYTLVLASFLVLSGSTADRVGRRRVFMTGLTVFTIGSALCAVAPTLGTLIAARVLQGIGGSMLNPVALSIVRNVFEEPKERAQAIGMWSSTVGLGTALGPIVGGALVDGPGWRFVFLINVPIGIAALILMKLYVPESRSEHPRRLDPVGQVLVIAALASLVYAIIEGASHGWTSVEILTLFAVSLAAALILVVYELRREQPLLEMRFFRSAPFSGATAIAVCAYSANGAYLFLTTVYLQSARGMSAVDAGLCTIPLALCMLVLSPIAGRMIGHIGTRVPLLIAGVALTASPLMLAGLTAHTPVAYLLAAYAVLGVGMGMANPPITITAVSGMPASQAGTAAAVTSTSRQVGATLGVAVIGAVVGSAGARHLGAGFSSATHAGWWIIAALGVTVLIIGAVTSTAWAARTARDTSERLATEGAVV